MKSKSNVKGKMLNVRHVVGIDEVGRGALAGPVVVTALLISTKLKIKNAELKIKKGQNCKLVKLQDSKKLSEKQREQWFRWIRQEKIPYETVGVSPKIIDKINISKAANLAATNAVRRLIQNSEFRIKNCEILLDGGLYLNNLKLRIKNLELTKTIIRGDEKIPAISLASIVAKVTRDRLMKKLHKKYPRYDFINNVGYGTRKHIKAIKKFGFSKIHRRSFRVLD